MITGGDGRLGKRPYAAILGIAVEAAVLS